MNKYIAMRSDLRRKADLIIACENSINKEYADLDLTGVADPAQVIMDAIAELDSQRESDDVAIVVEFMGGMITLGSENESMGELNLSDYKNLHIHGNGVTIESKGWDYVYALKIQDCCLYDLNLICYHGMIGIQAVDNCTITNCNVVMESLSEGFYVNKSILTNCKATVKNWGEGIWAENSILINCEAETGTIDYSLEGNSIYASKCTLLNCKGVMMGFDYGIYAEDSTITNCFGSSSSYGIYAEGSIVTGGCNGGNGGLLIDGSSYPQDLSIAQNLNFGYIIIQGVND
ncbi:MAG: hypothetical protein M0R40_10140 [Firmicutes bacterium]|nr:hypothetical protein [Bacillota bacterium]